MSNRPFYKNSNTGFFLIVLLFIFLSGCGFLNQDKLNPDIVMLKKGENAFLKGKYKTALPIFRAVYKNSNETVIKNVALYNLASLRLILSDNIADLYYAMGMLNSWKPSKNSSVLVENPLFLLLSIRKIVGITTKNRLQGKKRSDGKINKLQKMIKTLQYQISELQKIDKEIQAIQEKRKIN